VHISISCVSNVCAAQDWLHHDILKMITLITSLMYLI